MKVIRWLVLGVIGVLFLTLLIFTNKTDHSDSVWSEQMTIGKLDAQNYYIQYTDLACPYCNAFSLLLMDNEEEFKNDYIDGKNILYEVRVTDFLYEFGEHKTEMSRWSAEGVYCAEAEGKFWDYYHTALDSIYNDYYSQGVGYSKTAPMIKDMSQDYWIEIGHKIGLGDNFERCMNEHQMVQKITENTAKAAKQVEGGLPYFKFGKFKTGGFDPSWDWGYVKKYLDAGL